MWTGPRAKRLPAPGWHWPQGCATVAGVPCGRGGGGDAVLAVTVGATRRLADAAGGGQPVHALLKGGGDFSVARAAGVGHAAVVDAGAGVGGGEDGVVAVAVGADSAVATLRHSARVGA